MSRENFEYEAGKALNLPTNIIELARKGDGYDHAFDSMNIMQPLNGWWHWWKAGAASMQSERDQLAAQLADVVAENAALKAAEKRIAEQREYYESVIADGSKRIASLEARTLTVKLPKPHAHLIWIQAGHAPDDYWDDVAVSHSESDRCCDGSERYPVYARWEIEEMLTAAGIKLQIEGE